jgi:hypothetical protein
MRYFREKQVSYLFETPFATLYFLGRKPSPNPHIYQIMPECPALKSGDDQPTPGASARQRWHRLPGVWGSLFKPTTICPVVVGTAPKFNIIMVGAPQRKVA